MTTLNPERCRELLALRDKATPGPWSVVQSRSGRRGNTAVFMHKINDFHQVSQFESGEIRSRDKQICTVWNVTCTCIQGKQYRNQEFIASAPELAAQLEAALAEIERLRTQIRGQTLEAEHLRKIIGDQRRGVMATTISR